MAVITKRLDTLSSGQFGVLTAVSIAAFFLCLGSAVLGPPLFDTDKVTKANCAVLATEDCIDFTSSYTLSITDMEPRHRFLFLEVLPLNEGELDYDTEIETILLGKDSEDSISTDQVFEKTKTHRIKCMDGECTSILLFYEAYVEYSFYDLQIRFLTAPQFEKLEFTLNYVNPEFTRLELALKYLCLTTSVVSLCALVWSISRVPFFQVPFDSNIALAFSVSLVFFNDPLIAVSVYTPSEPLSVFRVFCTTQFLGVALILWYALLLRPTAVPRKLLILIVEAVLVVIFLGLATATYAYIHDQFKHDPTYEWKRDFSDTYETVYYALLAFLVICTVVLLVHMLLACLSLSKQPLRLRGITVLHVLMSVFTISGIVFGAFLTFPTKARSFIGFLTVLNLYVYFLAICLAPIRRTARESFRKSYGSPEIIISQEERPPRDSAASELDRMAA